MKRDERNIVRLLTKEIEIQLGKATRGGICKNSDYNVKTEFRYKYPNR